MNNAPQKQKILLVEDDTRLAQLTSEYLDRYEFLTTVVTRGDEALEQARVLLPDLIILDLSLPGMDGMEICRAIRRFSTVPILMLTARIDPYDQVAGLEIGADDYVLKPVEPRILVARARAVLRRTQSISHKKEPLETLHFGSLSISKSDRTVFWKGQLMPLKTAEFELLYLLASEAGIILSRDDILKRLRGIEFDGLDRSIDWRISRLRRRFDDASAESKKIKTVWGRGYLFSASAWDE